MVSTSNFLFQSSKGPCFPSGFEGVRFYSPFSLGGLWTLLGAQAVLWGGGQLLQGNRSRIKLLYWAGVVTLLRMLRKRIMGFAQGVGPFPRKFDRALARFAVNCTEVFTVRDPASLRTLEEINAPQRKIFLTADPALLLFPEATGNGRPMKEPEAVSQFHPDKHPTPTIGISFRYTRHHRSNRIIPFQFLPESLRRKAFESEDFSYFLATMSDLCDRIVVELHAGIMPSRVSRAFCAVCVVVKVSTGSTGGVSTTATVLTTPVSVPEMTSRNGLAEPSFKIVASTAMPALLIACCKPSRVSLVASMVIIVVTPATVISKVPWVTLLVTAA